MSNFSEKTRLGQERLAEITQKIDEENVSTDELLSMLEEAVNIGMQVCKNVQNNIDEQTSPKNNLNDGQQ